MASKPKTPKQRFRRKHPRLYSKLEELTAHLPRTLDIALEDRLILTNTRLSRYDEYLSYDYTERDVRCIIQLIEAGQKVCELQDLIDQLKKHRIRVSQRLGESIYLVLPESIQAPPSLQSLIAKDVRLLPPVMRSLILMQNKIFPLSNDIDEQIETLRQLLTALEAAAPAS